MSARISQSKLHEMFLNDVAPYAKDVFDSGKKPLLLEFKPPYCTEVKAYIFNCTCPPGARTIDEYKIQLIIDGQKRGERGRFDDSDGRNILIIGYADPLDDPDDGIWVLFEAAQHMEFAYSANIQIYLRQLLQAYGERVFIHQKHNKEIVVMSRRKYLKDALAKRFDIDARVLIGESYEEITGI